MRPELLFRLSFPNRGVAILQEGIFIRHIACGEYYRALYLMDFYYYELTWNCDQTELLYVAFIDEEDVEWIFPGKDESDYNLN